MYLFLLPFYIYLELSHPKPQCRYLSFQLYVPIITELMFSFNGRILLAKIGDWVVKLLLLDVDMLFKAGNDPYM